MTISSGLLKKVYRWFNPWIRITPGKGQIRVCVGRAPKQLHQNNSAPAFGAVFMILSLHTPAHSNSSAENALTSRWFFLIKFKNLCLIYLGKHC